MSDLTEFEISNIRRKSKKGKLKQGGKLALEKAPISEVKKPSERIIRKPKSDRVMRRMETKANVSRNLQVRAQKKAALQASKRHTLGKIGRAISRVKLSVGVDSAVEATKEFTKKENKKRRHLGERVFRSKEGS